MSSNQAFRASPLGDYTGILHVAGFGYSLRIVVVPKLWAMGIPPLCFSWAESEIELVVEVAETQQFLVTVSNTEQIRLLEHLVNLLATDSIAARLLELSQIREGIESIGPPKESLEMPLVTLGLRYGVVDMTTKALRGLLPGKSESVDKLVLFATYIQAASQVVKNHRAGYVQMQSVGPLVKGRPSAMDVALVEAGWSSTVRSHFHQITSRTPLMVVLASALKQVVLGCSHQAGTIAFDTLRRAASDLLYYWPAEPLLDAPAKAVARQADAQVLNDEEKRTLHLAKLILDGNRQASSMGSRTFAWFHVALDMPRLWELLVIEYFRGCGFSPVIDGNSAEGKRRILAPAPWNDVSTNSRRPDIAFFEQGRWHIGDVKYKHLQGKTPSSTDINQVFMYSQLASVDGNKPARVDLVYPTRLASGVAGPFLGCRSHVPPLYVREVPFPAPTN